MRSALASQRLVALCVLGWLLFNYPLLALFNDAGTIFSIPLLYAYLFFAWALLICLMALIVERKHLREKQDPPSAPTPRD